LHLGFEGYRAIALDDLKNARVFSRALEKSGYFTVLSDIHRPATGSSGLIKGVVGFDEEDVEVCVTLVFYHLLSFSMGFQRLELYLWPSGGLFPLFRRVPEEEP
jgi:hypothetical protein